jgi:hypothetical protein
VLKREITDTRDKPLVVVVVVVVVVVPLGMCDFKC